MRKFDYSNYKQFKIINIFEYYDRPLFYIAESPNKDVYMFYFIESENKDSVWFTAQVSKNEVSEIYKQQIGELEFLQKLYTMNRLFKCYFTSDENGQCSLSFTLINEENIDFEDFPEENYFAEHDYLSDQELVPIPKVFEDKKTFKIILKDAINSHQVNIDFLISTLNNVKYSLNSLVKDSVHSLNADVISKPIDIDVIAFQPSSFGIWFEVNSTELDLYNLTNISVNSFFELLSDINLKDEKDITDKIFIEQRYSIDSIKKIDTFLNHVVDSKYDLKIEGYPEGTLTNNLTTEPLSTVEFKTSNTNNIQKLKNILSGDSSITHEEIIIEGTFVSVNLKKNGFWITTEDGDIHGLFESTVFEKLKNETNFNIQVPSKVKTKLLKIVTKDHIAENYSTKYTLLSFEYIG